MQGNERSPGSHHLQPAQQTFYFCLYFYFYFFHFLCFNFYFELNLNLGFIFRVARQFITQAKRER